MAANQKKKRLFMALKQLKELMDLSDDENSRQRRMWLNPFLQKRELHNLEEHLLKDLLWKSDEYKNFCRMHITDFEEILALVDLKIKKKDTVIRFAISSRLRLAVTLRYLATGDSFRSLEYLSRISRKTMSEFVPEVLLAVIENLNGQHMKMPCNESEWMNVVEGFDRMWQFPNTLGAIDGKHIRVQKPGHSGSQYYNYKGHCSIILLAVVDAYGKFIYIDVGGYGHNSDTCIYNNSSLCKALERERLNIPRDNALPGQVSKTSYYFIGDDIFGLDRHLLKAFNKNSSLSKSQEAFNYRLSRARMPVEMAFGRLANRFRIFHRPIDLLTNSCDLVVQACCVLHNYLTKESTEPINIEDVTTEELPYTITPLPKQSQERLKFAAGMRDNVRKYVVTDGDVPFQWEKIKKQKAIPVTVTLE